jgi:uncharacterized protein (TIGR03437 family)
MPNAIQIENSLPGTSDWKLTFPAYREIEGYASLTSVAAGQQISFFVNTADPTYRLEIFRTGWYGGAGGRQMSWQGQNSITSPSVQQPMPTADPATGLIECRWTNPIALAIPSSWVSGVYLAKLTALASGRQSYIIFVVRDDARNSDVLFQVSFTTYQAYNEWPGRGDFFKSFYAGADAVAATKVSFNRPYTYGLNADSLSGVGAAEYLTNFHPSGDTPPCGWEYNMVRWIEKEGYDVSYCTNIDVHASPNLLLSHKCFLSVGHDEYWSWEMRQNVEVARDRGVNLGFFSSNTCYWQVRFEPDSNGNPYGTMTCYKSMADTADPMAADNDPPTGQLLSKLWRTNDLKPPEQTLLGNMTCAFTLSTDMIITDATHWCVAGTGLNNGAVLNSLVGFEANGVFDSPSIPGLQIIARSPIPPAGTPGLQNRDLDHSDMVSYTAPSGAIVVSTGSMQWSWGLDDYRNPVTARPALSSAAVQQITRNILNRFLANSPSGPLVCVSPTAVALKAARAQQFGSFVGGLADASVTWSISPATGNGSISATGLYSAPAVISSSRLITLNCTSVSDPAKSCSAIVGLVAPVIPPLPKTGPLPTPIRVQAGGIGLMDAQGRIWHPDGFFTGGDGFATKNDINGTDTAALYQTERYGTSFSYNFPLANGAYFVNLKFAELDPTVAVGGRVLNVILNGVQVLSNLDVLAAAGRFTAMDKALPIQVQNGQVAVQFDAVVAYAAINAIEILQPQDLPPQITSGRVVNGGSFQPGLAPGGLASLFGSNLSTATASASDSPFPNSLSGVQVTVDGIAAPLLYSSPGQVNFQVPFEVQAGNPVPIVVIRDGVSSAPAQVPIVEYAPGILTYTGVDNNVYPLIQHLDNSFVDPGHPAVAGEILMAFLTGVGGFVDHPPTGTAPPVSPLSITVITPSIVLGGVAADVLWSGLSPTRLGVVQINLQLPNSLPAGTALPLTFTFDTATSQTVQLAVLAQLTAHGSDFP